MVSYEEAIVKLTIHNWIKLRSEEKNKTGPTLEITKKTFKMKNYHMNYF